MANGTEGYRELDARVREVETDFAEHEGRSAVFWEDQHRTNTATLTGMEKLADRTDAVEKRFSWVWGVAAGVTGLIATVAAASKLYKG